MEKAKVGTENEAEKEEMDENAMVEENAMDDENAGPDNLMVLVFKFICPMCGKFIRSTQQSTKSGESTYFSLSNVERHWKIHAGENQPKKPKKPKDKRSKSEPRKLRSKKGSKAASECDVKNEVPRDDDEFEILTDGESNDEGPRDFKIVQKKKAL